MLYVEHDTNISMILQIFVVILALYQAIKNYEYNKYSYNIACGVLLL